MTRQDIAEQYRPDSDGLIRTPGKFEHEMLYVPYFWDAALNGDSSTDTGSVFFTIIDDLDRAQFPELGTAYGIALEESEQGFIYSRLFATREEYERYVNRCQSEESSEEN
jgi:hypothetical protein